jgi:hypothetical protein
MLHLSVNQALFELGNYKTFANTLVKMFVNSCCNYSLCKKYSNKVVFNNPDAPVKYANECIPANKLLPYTNREFGSYSNF